VLYHCYIKQGYGSICIVKWRVCTRLGLIKSINFTVINRNIMEGSKKTLRTCNEGHKYYKSTDCPSCPICEQQHKPADGFLSKLGGPAGRALENNGITTLQQLSGFSRKDILKLHGIGPNTIPKLLEALDAEGLSFKN
jgi:hypothetical protein